jgi:hypothetical protein
MVVTLSAACLGLRRIGLELRLSRKEPHFNLRESEIIMEKSGPENYIGKNLLC